MHGMWHQDLESLEAISQDHLTRDLFLRMAAEEALEDVFWEVWKKADRFDAQRGSPMNYLLSLTQSRAIDKLRGRAKLRRMLVPQR